MRTIEKQAAGIGNAVRLLGMVPALLLCAWILTTPARADYQYVLEVNTDLNTGTETQVQFFILTYDADAGSGVDLHNKLIFPYDGNGDLAEGFARVTKTTQTAKDAAAASSYGYTAAGLPTTPFRERKRDQYLFTTETPIAQMERIQAFVSATPLSATEYKGTTITDSGGGSWNCDGIRLFRVDQLGQMYRYNFGSQDQYIDFRGELIAECGKYSYNWQSDKLLDIGARTGGAAPLLTTSFDKDYAARSLQDPAKPQLAVHFEFADVALGGLESLSTTPSRMPRTLESLRECMALTMFYVDRYGTVRQTEIPVGIGAADWAARLGVSKDAKIAGIGQQGEGLSVPIFLPDFGSFRPSDRFTVTLGSAKAAAVLGCTEGSVAAESNGARLAGLAIYELDGATLGSPGGEKSITTSIDATSQCVAWNYKDLRPTWYHIANSTSGEPLAADASSNISLQIYDGGRLKPRESGSKDRILVEIVTDTVPGAGTRSDFLMQITYKDLSGNTQTMGSINIRERAMDFIGYWPGTPQDDRLGYYLSAAEGQTLRFFVDIPNLQEITDMRLRMADGQSDDWQIKDLSLFSVSSYDKRTIQWEEINASGLYTDRRINRFVDATLLYTMNGTTDKPTNPSDDSGGGGTSGGGTSGGGTSGGGTSGGGTGGGGTSGGGTSGGTTGGGGTSGGGGSPGGGGTGGGITGGWPVLIQGGGEAQPVGPGGGTGIDVTGGPTQVDWSQLRYSMTFQEASQDLGFTRSRVTYDVAVHVASLDDDTSEENEDCGSKNLFYFRLLFNSGSSSYVLANQQLAGDAFRTGMVEHFYISANQDYGAVTAVQIIPEDMSSDSDKFDKLKIDMIEISVAEDAALIPTWTIHNVGWIDIDYRDDAQLTAIVGQEGRSAEDLARVYLVDGTTFKSSLMVTITTGDQASTQFQGAVGATIYYQKTNGETGTETVDVVKSIYTFIKHAADPDSQINGKLKGDPALMFRPHTTDRFLVSVSDIQRVNRIELSAYSETSTTWYVDDVSVYLYKGAGRLLLNTYGEYQYFYSEEDQPVKLCSGDSTEVPHPYKQDFTAASTGAVALGLINVNLTENEVELNADSKQWNAIISREPVSQNDTLDLFIYPGSVNRGSAGGSPTVAIQYTTSGKDDVEQIVPPLTRDMNVTQDNGVPVYYATNISVPGMKNLNRIIIGTGTTNGIMDISRAIVQRVRDGVIISTREMSGVGLSDNGIILTDRTATVQDQQRLRFQLSPDTPAVALVPDVNDLAVCMWFRSAGPAGTEFRTPYVYLTDQGYTSIGPGQIVDLTFDQTNVADITGFSFVAAGNVTATISAAYVLTEQVSLETGATVPAGTEYSFATPLTVSGLPGRLAQTPDTPVQELALTFVTDQSTEAAIAGTDGPVRVTLGYYDRNYDLRTRTIEDIRPYLASGAGGFQSGSTEEAELLVSGVRELRYVELVPVSRDAASPTKATWMLKSFAAKLGSGPSVERGVGQTIYEGTPLRVLLANILLSADLETIQPVVEVEAGETPQVPTEGMETPAPTQLNGGGSTDLFLGSGQGVQITPTLEGSEEGFTVTLERLHYESGATGPVSLADTRGYTAEYLAQRAAEASTEQEAAIWLAAELSPGSFEPQSAQALRNGTVIRFIPPRNYTGGALSYRLRVIPVEAPGTAVTVNVTVEDETDPVQQRLEDYRLRLQLENQRKMEELQDQLNSMGSGGSPGGGEDFGGGDTDSDTGDTGDTGGTGGDDTGGGTGG